MSDNRVLEWQRRLDPARFNKKRGAQYHTAPVVLPHDAVELPDELPDEALGLLFYIDAECWLGAPEKTEVQHPVFHEGTPRTKTAKNGPVFVLSDTAALCAIPVKENYYWAANTLAQHEVLWVSFSPGKNRTDGKPRKIRVVAAFLPDDEA